VRWFINCVTLKIIFHLFAACIPARYILSILGSIAMAIIYGLKVNLSVAMVAMVNQTAVRLMNPHTEDNHGGSNISLRVECEAENRTSSAVSQVN
jgi:hypothetical protein